MATDDLQVAGRQRVEATEVTFGQIGGDAHERVALLGRQQAECLGYYAARSMQPAAGMQAVAWGRRIYQNKPSDRFAPAWRSTDLWLHLESRAGWGRLPNAYS